MSIEIRIPIDDATAETLFGLQAPADPSPTRASRHAAPARRSGRPGGGMSQPEFAAQVAELRAGLAEFVAFMARAKRDMANMEIARDAAFARLAETIADNMQLRRHRDADWKELARVARERDRFARRFAAAALLLDDVACPRIPEPIVTEVRREPSLAGPVTRPDGSKRLAQRGSLPSREEHRSAAAPASKG